MKRSGGLKRKTRLRPRSERAVSYAEELDAVKPLLDVRAGYRCEICRIRPISQYHHRLRRSQGGKNNLANLLALCDKCHFIVHDRPEQSYELGWLLRRNSLT